MQLKAEPLTAVCKNGGFSEFLETFVTNQSLGIFSNFSAESPPLLQAAKRWWQHYDDWNVEKNPENLTLKTKNSKRKIKTK